MPVPINSDALQDGSPEIKCLHTGHRRPTRQPQMRSGKDGKKAAAGSCARPPMGHDTRQSPRHTSPECQKETSGTQEHSQPGGREHRMRDPGTGSRPALDWLVTRADGAKRAREGGGATRGMECGGGNEMKGHEDSPERNDHTSVLIYDRLLAPWAISVLGKQRLGGRGLLGDVLGHGGWLGWWDGCKHRMRAAGAEREREEMSRDPRSTV